MNIPSIFWIVPAASVVALSFAWAFYRLMKREDEGTPRMREIAAHVRKGAMAYRCQQYKVVGIVFAVLALFFCLAGLRRRGAERLGSLRLHHRRLFLGACGLLRHEDREPTLRPVRPMPRGSRWTAA